MQDKKLNRNWLTYNFLLLKRWTSLKLNSGNNTVKLRFAYTDDKENESVYSMAGGKITAIAEKKIYLWTHSDLHVILLNLQIVPIMQNLNGHKSLHGIIGVSIY